MAATYVKMKNPNTGKIEVMSPQNALDMEQHNGWKRVGHVKVKAPYTASSQDVLDSKGTAVRRNSAEASRDIAPEVEEEEVDELGEVDTESEADDEELDSIEDEPADEDVDENGDDYATRSAVAAGR